MRAFVVSDQFVIINDGSTNSVGDCDYRSIGRTDQIRSSVWFFEWNVIIICVMVLNDITLGIIIRRSRCYMPHAFWIIIRFIQIIMRDSGGVMKPKRHVDIFRYHLIMNIEYSNIFLEMCFIFIFFKLSFAKGVFSGKWPSDSKICLCAIRKYPNCHDIVKKRKNNDIR